MTRADHLEACIRPTVRVAVVSPFRMYREGLATSLASYPRMMIVGVAADVAEAARLLPLDETDVAVLDIAGRYGLDMLRALRACAPTVRPIALAVEEADCEILACVEVGVAGYVSRDGSLADLVAAIECAMRGELGCSPRVSATLLRRVAALAPPSTATALLTIREREVVTLVESGLSTKQIAQSLFIKVATVKNHVHNILEKLHVASRAQAAARVRGYAPARASVAVTSERAAAFDNRARA